jgi:cell division protein FtsL
MKTYELEKQRKLDGLQAQRARHEKAIYITLMTVVILVGLVIAWFVKHLFNQSL